MQVKEKTRLRISKMGNLVLKLLRRCLYSRFYEEVIGRRVTYAQRSSWCSSYYHFFGADAAGPSAAAGVTSATGPVQLHRSLHFIGSSSTILCESFYEQTSVLTVIFVFEINTVDCVVNVSFNEK